LGQIEDLWERELVWLKNMAFRRCPFRQDPEWRDFVRRAASTKAGSKRRPAQKNWRPN
jgi:hypothetical protein